MFYNIIVSGWWRAQAHLTPSHCGEFKLKCCYVKLVINSNSVEINSPQSPNQKPCLFYPAFLKIFGTYNYYLVIQNTKPIMCAALFNMNNDIALWVQELLGVACATCIRRTWCQLVLAPKFPGRSLLSSDLSGNAHFHRSCQPTPVLMRC